MTPVEISAASGGLAAAKAAPPARRSHWPQRSAYAGFGLALTLLALIAWFGYYSFENMHEQSRWVRHTHTVLAQISRTLLLIKDSESTAFAYIISADKAVRDAVLPSKVAAKEAIASLRRLTSDNPAQLRRLATFEALSVEYFDVLDAAIKAFDAGQHSAGSPLIAAVKPSVERIRDVGAEMTRAELALRGLRVRDASRGAAQLRYVLVIGNAVAFVVLIAAFWCLRREIVRRESAQSETLRYADEVANLYEYAPCGYHSLNPDGHIIRMNHTELTWLGYAHDEVVGKLHITQLLTPESAELFSTKSFPSFRGAGWIKDIERDFVRKDGTVMHTLINAVAIHDGAGNFIESRSTVYDITARKQAETQLALVNSFTESLVDNVPAMLFVKDARYLRFVRFNKAGEELLGLTRAEMIGKSDYDFFPREEADHFVAQDRYTLQTGERVEIPEEAIHTRKQGVRLLHTSKIPVKDANGEPLYLLGISLDITERRTREKEIVELNASLQERSEQLEAINAELESFSYSVSHDLRTPLRAIAGYARILEEDYADKLDEEGQRLLRVVYDNTLRMGTLISDLLTFSQLGRAPLTRVQVDMTELVKQIFAELTRNDAGATPTFQMTDLPAAEGDPVLLRQVWINLLANAVKFSRASQNSTVTVSASRQALELVYTVTDNGVGFDMQYAHKLFGVFQRLHGQAQFPGTGVGLAIVKRIVQRHGGRVWADGALGVGATFYFSLPEGKRDG